MHWSLSPLRLTGGTNCMLGFETQPFKSALYTWWCVSCSFLSCSASFQMNRSSHQRSSPAMHTAMVSWGWPAWVYPLSSTWVETRCLQQPITHHKVGHAHVLHQALPLAVSQRQVVECRCMVLECCHVSDGIDCRCFACPSQPWTLKLLQRTGSSGYN